MPDGVPTPAPADTSAPPTDAALRSILALPGTSCPHCAYSLAGLAGQHEPPTRCPECGGGLAPGLVGSAAPKALRRVLILMLAWVACAGGMNATRQWLSIWDFYINVPVRTRFVGNYAPAATPPVGLGGVPQGEWVTLGWWVVLAVAGLAGIIAALLLPRTLRNQRRLLTLVVACFLLYWGYHAMMFTYEMIER